MTRAHLCAGGGGGVFALFGLPFSASFSAPLHLGVVLLLIAPLTTGVGLLRGVSANANVSPGL